MVGALDSFRGRCLRLVMPFSAARYLYLDRSRRLMAQFVISASVALLLSFYFPLWVLAVGPVVYGLPHLLASARYLRRSSRVTKPIFGDMVAVLSISAGVAVIRLLPFTSRGIVSTNVPELICLSALVALLVVSQRLSLSLGARALASTFLFVGLSLHYPKLMIGFLILGHNFVAFFHWIRASQTEADRRTAWRALAIFSLGTLYLFSSGYAGDWSVLGINTWDLGRQIFPSIGVRPDLWGKAVMAYAFGQSMHYFVWLKAIPEQQLSHQTPSSFRQSYFWLTRDFGKRGTLVALGLILALSSVWILTNFAQARLAYLAMASFHGYAELAFLFASSRKW